MHARTIAAGVAVGIFAFAGQAMAANDPAAVFAAYAAAVNRGDTEGVRALISNEAAPIKFPLCTPAMSNRDCLLTYIDTTVIKRNGNIKTVDVKVEGDIVRAAIELRSDMAKRANVDRAIGVDEILTRDNKIVSLRFIRDPDDAQTKAYFGGIPAPK